MRESADGPGEIGRRLATESRIGAAELAVAAGASMKGLARFLALVVPLSTYAPLVDAVTQSVVSTSTCVNQHSPEEESIATEVFTTITPRRPTGLLENPLNRGVHAALTMLTFGDSAMWGNGLKDSYKYAYLVAQYVADGTGRSVHLVSYAHSGANLAIETDSCYEPMIASDSRPPGDLNAGLPTGLQQASNAAVVARYNDAELILLDGCINDVGAEKIALPFPFSRSTPEEIRHLAHEQCSDNMVKLLRYTLDHFKKATIIVSNYWLIISDKSSPIGLALSKPQANFTPQDRKIYRDINNLLATELKAEEKLGQHFTDTNALMDPKAVLLKWSDNSKAFLETSETCFDWAVATVDGKTSRPNGPDGCPNDAGHIDPQTVSDGVRTFLAKVSCDPRYSYGAGKDKRIWSVPSRFFRPDQLYSKRARLCSSHYDHGDPAERFICYVNPTAHPNISGARAYRDSITDILGIAWAGSVAGATRAAATRGAPACTEN